MGGNAKNEKNAEKKTPGKLFQYHKKGSLFVWNKYMVWIIYIIFLFIFKRAKKYNSRELIHWLKLILVDIQINGAEDSDGGHVRSS